MCFKNQECTIVEKYRILSQMCGITNVDIRTLTGCSPAQATKIIFEIHKLMAAEGAIKRITPRRVNREWFCRYMDWSFDEIKQLAFEEMAAIRSVVRDVRESV